ncbi:MAG: gamma-glutamyltransferase family protein, partial [Gammaproteobacteria bacterium]
MNRSLRSPVFGTRGMVASSQTAATQAGIDILRRGGSAVDAAIATNAALSVIEPHMCGMGGDLFAIVWDPKQQGLIGLNASGKSPLGLSTEELRSRAANGFVPGRGPLSITTPGAVDGWCMLHDSYGLLSLAEVLKPARDLAEHGAPIGIRTSAAWQEAAQHLQADKILEGLLAPFQSTYAPAGRAPRAGDVHRNSSLAETFRLVGEGGSAAFYEGEIAQKLLAYLRGAGCAISEDDLANNRAEWVQPIATRYRDVDVYELPPNGQGLSVLQILNLLEGFPLAEYSPADPRYWHLFLEAKKLAFEDRAAHFADPEFYAAPNAELLDKRYASERAALISANKAAGDFAPGQFALPHSDTTYLCAADSNGLMVSLIQSIFSPFGSGLVSPELGFAMQSRGAGFNLDDSHPNCYRPGKRPFHTIIPGFVCRGSQPWFAFGVMGADMQPQGQVQVLCNMIDFAMDPQAAGDALRIRHDGGKQPNGRHMDAIGVAQY